MAAVIFRDPKFSAQAPTALAALKAWGMDRAHHSYILSWEQQQAHGVTAFSLKAVTDAYLANVISNFIST